MCLTVEHNIILVLVKFYEKKSENYIRVIRTPYGRPTSNWLTHRRPSRARRVLIKHTMLWKTTFFEIARVWLPFRLGKAFTQLTTAERQIYIVISASVAGNWWRKYPDNSPNGPSQPRQKIHHVLEVDTACLDNCCRIAKVESWICFLFSCTCVCDE